MRDSKRIVYLDIAKGIGMLLVVIGHVEYVSTPIRQYITTFHMPLFFLIAGLLIWEKADEEKKFIELVKNRLHSLMIPYAVFSVLSFLIEGTRLLIKGLDGWDNLFRQLYQSVCLQGVSTLWFLPALFISNLVFVWIRRHSSHLGTVIAVLFMTLAVFFLNGAEKELYRLHSDSLPWGMLHDVLSMILRNVFCVSLVMIGYYIGKLLHQYTGRGFLDAGIGSLLLVLTGMTAQINGGADLRSMQLGNLFLYLSGAVCGSLGVLLVCRDIERIPFKVPGRIFAYYGRNSLLIMATHMDFRVLYCSIIAAELVNTFFNNNYLFCGLIVIFVFLAEIFVIEFFNRFLPFLLQKKVKNS